MKTSLYIHIPFCRTKCDYCDFFSVACGKNSIPDEYVKALSNEIVIRSQLNNIDGFSTVYIGGGTPSLLLEGQLKQLCDTINSFGKDEIQEFTIEANPDDITEKLLDDFAKNGINRLSCGIQAFEQNILSGVKRRSSQEKVYEALESIKKSWKGIFSADIIAALPGQTEQGFLSGLSELVGYQPDHISMYSLTIEEETPLGKALFDGKLNYDFEDGDKIWLAGRNFLEEKGYLLYEVSNFAPKGLQCRHNLVYWRLENYLGCGSGATGSIYGKNGIRFTNSTDIKEYVHFWNRDASVILKDMENAPGCAEVLSEETQVFEFFMMGLRTLQGVCLDDFEARFCSKVPEYIMNRMIDWEKQKLAAFYITEGKKYYSLNKDGILFLNNFLREII